MHVGLHNFRFGISPATAALKAIGGQMDPDLSVLVVRGRADGAAAPSMRPRWLDTSATFFCTASCLRYLVVN